MPYQKKPQKRTHCLHCDAFLNPHAGRSDRLFCSGYCRKMYHSFQKKMARAGVEPMTADDLQGAKITISDIVFRQDMSVLEAIKNGAIRIKKRK